MISIISETGILFSEYFFKAADLPLLYGISEAIDPADIQDTEIESFLKYSRNECVTPRTPNFVAV